jgi:hypothetical protein
MNVTNPSTAYNSIAFPTVDIRGTGALVNGVTDDTVAWQTAFAALPSTGGTIHTPAGTSLISAVMTIPSNVHIVGDGPASIVQVTQASGIVAPFDLEGVSNVEISDMTLSCSTSPATCRAGIKINGSQHIRIHDMTISGGGSVTSPLADTTASQIHIQASDDVKISYVRTTNGPFNGGFGIMTFYTGPPNTRITLEHDDIENYQGDINVGFFNAQFSSVSDTFVNGANYLSTGPGSLTGGYGLMSYTLGGYGTAVYTVSSLSCSGSTCIVTISGGALPAVGVTFEAYLGSITGGTPPNSQTTFNGNYEATVTSPTTFTINAPGASSSGVVLTHTFTGTVNSSATITSVSSFTGLQPFTPITGTGMATNNVIEDLNTGAGTFDMFLSNTSSGSQTLTGSAFMLFPSAHNHFVNNRIIDTAGSGIYFAACDDCIAGHNTIKNSNTLETDTSLAAAGIAVTGGLVFGFNDVLSDNIVDTSGTSCVEFTSGTGVVIDGGSYFNCANAGIYARGGSEANTNFSIGGGIAISNVQNGIKVGSGINTNGQISFGTIENFSVAGISTIDATVESNNIQFNGGKIISTSVLPCVYEFQDRMTYNNIDCVGGFISLNGTNTHFNNLNMHNLASGAAIQVFGAQHQYFDGLNVDSVPQGVTLGKVGGSDIAAATQPSDIWFRNINFNNVSQSFLTDQAPGSGFTGDTHGTTTVDNLSSTAALEVGAILGDYSGGGSNTIPPGDTIVSITNTGCPAGCSVVLTNAATGSASGDMLTVWNTIASGVHILNGSVQGPSATDIGLLSNCIQNLDIESLNMQGFSPGTNQNLLDIRGCTANASVTQSTLVSRGGAGSSTFAVNNGANSILGTGNTVYGTDQYSILDESIGTGNYYASNTLGLPIFISNTNSSFSVNSDISGTGVPSGALCATKNQNMVYNQTDATPGQNIWVCLGGTWVHQTGTLAGAAGLATLTSGTSGTISNAAACTASSSCVYKFTNCGPNSSTAIGTPSLGTVVAGTSFVINSLTAINTVVTGDASNICWQIN